MIGVEKIPTPCAKKPKTTKTFSNKSAESFQSIGDSSSTTLNDFDVDGCNISLCLDVCIGRLGIVFD
jgi:hypothetical protein